MEFIFGLIVLALDIWAIVNIVGSAASTGAKILWSLLILILPIVGFIIWFFAGPRSRTEYGLSDLESTARSRASPAPSWLWQPPPQSKKAISVECTSAGPSTDRRAKHRS